MTSSMWTARSWHASRRGRPPAARVVRRDRPRGAATNTCTQPSTITGGWLRSQALTSISAFEVDERAWDHNRWLTRADSSSGRFWWRVTHTGQARLMAADMDDVAERILELREAYREAGETIDRFAEGIEREVGLASLRLEATQTYNRLMSRGRGLKDSATDPLKAYVGSLSGGEFAEQSVRYLDQQARQAVIAAGKTLYSALLGTAALSGVTLTLGIVFAAAHTAENIGATAWAAFVAGGSAAYGLYRLVVASASGLSSGYIRSMDWASNVGRRSDAALAKLVRLHSASGKPQLRPHFPSRLLQLRVNVRRSLSGCVYS